MIGLVVGQRVIVSLSGQRFHGDVLEVYVRSYLIKLDGIEKAERFSASKVRPESSSR